MPEHAARAASPLACERRVEMPLRCAWHAAGGVRVFAACRREVGRYWSAFYASTFILYREPRSLPSLKRPRPSIETSMVVARP